MFDTVVATKKNPIRCPGCKKICQDFQTKDLDNFMDYYVEGTTQRAVPVMTMLKKKGPFGLPLWKKTGKINHFPHPVYNQIYTYDWCEGCKKMIAQLFRFDESGLLTRHGEPFFET
ncbi:MAG: hypothetical protein ABL876_07955 [Chitinophagaceae bacterium]